jgi:hypothetical protein
MVLSELPLFPDVHATAPVRVIAASAAMVKVRRIAIPFELEEGRLNWKRAVELEKGRQ